LFHKKPYGNARKTQKLWTGRKQMPDAKPTVVDASYFKRLGTRVPLQGVGAECH
jgi:hypothetical protein